MGHCDHGNEHHHHHGHGHHHHIDPSQLSERRLWWAVGANVFLTFVQIIGGLISGSLSLIADALHNFSDAASLFIALIAIRIGRKPADHLKTFGYKRAETIAALINLVSLVIIGLFLCYEAMMRFIDPQPIIGWTVVIVASGALLVDVVTAALTFSQSKHSMNIRAVFLHNLTDAMASVGVILSGVLILLYDWVWTDAAITLVIAAYILWQGFVQLPQVIHLLMDGTPKNIHIADVIESLKQNPSIINAHHVHIWQLNEQSSALEAHIIWNGQGDMDQVKGSLKLLLQNKFNIVHSTLEFEINPCDNAHCH